MAYASSTDCVGPIAKSIEDVRIVLNAMSGKDARDQTSYVSEAVSTDLKVTPIKTVGYYKNFIENNAISTEIQTDFLATLEKIKAKGIAVKALDFFDADILVSTYYTLAMAETASNLSRLDGTNYGARIEGANLKDTYSITRSENFSEETKRRVVGGNQVLSQGFSDEIYLKAQNLRNQISARFTEDFKDVDIVLSPVTPASPPEIGESLQDPLAMYLSDAYTVGFSLGGLPALTIPKGTSTGLQITAYKKKDAEVLQFANFLNEIL